MIQAAKAGRFVTETSAVYGLVSNIAMASKIADAARKCHLAVHNFDRAEPLITHAIQKKPKLVILDWDACEAEAFKTLKELAKNADLKGVPAVGYVSGAREVLKQEAQRAGCYRVYSKTEFIKEMELIMARYAK